MSQLDSLWIDFSIDDDCIIVHENERPYAAIRARGLSCEPQLIMLIGDHAKNTLMNSAFGTTCIGNHDQIHLRTTSYGEKHPVFVADCELHNIEEYRRSVDHPAGILCNRRSLRWQRRFPHGLLPSALARVMYTNMISPFCTIICFFAEDLGGINGAASTLARWLLDVEDQPSDLPPSAYPKVLIIQQSEERLLLDEKLATRDFMCELLEEVDLKADRLDQRLEGKLDSRSLDHIIKRRFSSIEVVLLPNDDIYHRRTASTRARDRLLAESDLVQQQRSHVNFSFNSNHFTALLGYSCCQFVSDNYKHFQFIQTSRTSNPIPGNAHIYISKFLQLVSPRMFESFAVPILASALILDAYPPNMHFFDPESMFRTLYLPILKSAKMQLLGMCADVADKLESTVMALFVEHASKRDTAMLHRSVLQKEAATWSTVFSNTTCLSCLLQPPENILSCHHSLCDSCLINHGINSIEEPWTFQFSTCPLCLSRNTNVFRMKPPTAGVRGLVINNGMSIDSEVLTAIEQELSLPGVPLASHFDMVNGTGQGALLLLYMFCNKWSLQECTQHIEEVKEARQNQRQHLRHKPRSRNLGPPTSVFEIDDTKTVMQQIVSALPLHWYHPTKRNNLKKSFEPAQYLFSSAGHGTKVAITACNARDPNNVSTSLFTNYNGVDTRHRRYNVIRPEQVKDELFVWQVGRASGWQKGHGSYLGHHSKENWDDEVFEIAKQECQLVWAQRRDTPDCLIYLGAGTTGMKQKKSDWLRDHRRDNVNMVNEIKETAEILIASLFYIELLTIPRQADQGIQCVVMIRCRLAPSQSALFALITRLHHDRAHFVYNNTKSMECVSQQIYDDILQGHSFSRSIRFSIFSLDDEVDIKITNQSFSPKRISNCPYTVSSMIRDQKLDCVFGYRDHQKRFLTLGV